MRTILGVFLISIGFVLGWTTNFLQLEAEAELLRKRPDLTDGHYFWRFRNPYWIGALYKAELPDGRRMRQFWLCFVTAAIAFVSGAILIGFFR